MKWFVYIVKCKRKLRFREVKDLILFLKKIIWYSCLKKNKTNKKVFNCE